MSVKPILLAIVMGILPVLMDNQAANAQSIVFEKLTVLTDQEATDAGQPLRYLEITFSTESVPDDYMLIVHKYFGVPHIGYDTVLIGDLPDGKWYDDNSFSDDQSERFFLELLDQGGDAAAPASYSHSSIFLYKPVEEDIDRCSRSINLKWGNYRIRQTIGQGADLPVFFTHNRIWVMPPGESDYTMVGEIDFADAEYEGYTLNQPGIYWFRIESVEMVGGSERRFSRSNPQDVDYRRPFLNDLELFSVDVVENRDIAVIFSTAGDVDDFEYEVFRSDSINGDYKTVGLVTGGSGGILSFTDTSVPDIDAGPYYYKTAAYLTGCEGHHALESDTISSLFLTGNISAYDESSLVIALEGFHFPGGMGYVLYRMLPDEDAWTTVTSGLSLDFVDDLSAQMETIAGEIRYVLQGTDGTSNVRSNIASIFVETELVIPNAFRPESTIDANRYFRPGFRGQTPAVYHLSIYNRWGQEIFSITDPGNNWPGWDGKDSSGNILQQGVYGFRLEYQIGNNPREEKMGTVMLVR